MAAALRSQKAQSGVWDASGASVDRLQVAWPSVFCRVSIGAPITLKIRFLANQGFHVFNVDFRDERLSPLKKA